MFTLSVKNAAGNTYELTHDPDRYFVIDVDGLAPMPITLGMSEGNFDGALLTSAKAATRNIVITLVLNGDIETNRQRVYKIFPLKKACTVFFANKNRSVKISAYVETIEDNFFAAREKIQISLICPSAWFESAYSTDFVPSYTVPLFSAPFSIEQGDPIPVSEVADHPTALISNTGDAECGMVITASFTGAVTGFKITNETTGDYIAITNTFASGNKLTIDTRRGQLSASCDGVNFIGKITSGSKWIKLPTGVNRLGVTADSGVDNAAVTFTAAFLYGGV
jgi:hypothetical protein